MKYAFFDQFLFELRCWKFNFKRVFTYKIPWFIAFHLPAKIALYAFVRVHSCSGDGPCECGYKKHYNLFKEQNDIEEC